MEQNKKWKLETALFLASQGISLFGSSLVQFAMIWYVTKETGSGVWVSALTLCSFLPQMLISFAAGAWADRYSKKLLIMLSDTGIAAATLVLALLIPFIGDNSLLLTAIMLVSVIRSLGAGIQQPAVGAILPEFVPQESLMRVNGINSTIQSIVQFAAPAAAGAILTFSSMRSTLFIDVVTAAVAVAILGALALPRAVRAPSQVSAIADIKAGARYTFGHKLLGKLLGLYGGFIFLCVPAGFMAALFVTRNYGDSYVYLSIVEIVGFVGMMLGGLLIGTWGGFKNRMKTLVVGMLAFGALGVGMGAVHNFIVYLVLMAIYGIALTMVQTAVTTMIQEKAQPELQGRVFGFMGTIYSGFLPLGMVTFGPLSDAVSLNLLMIIAGALLLVATLAVMLDRKFYRQGTPEVQPAEQPVASEKPAAAE